MKRKFSDDDIARKLINSMLAHSDAPNMCTPVDDDMLSLNERISQILNIINKKPRPAQNMLFFVMYDISSNKVRTLVSRYLIGRGCTRIQCSIFLADLNVGTYSKIKEDLAEVQSAYDNNDSIIIVPIAEGLLDSMKIIGKEIDIDVIAHRKNTLFV
jgi:CRISPR-associated endonuclease Cas2